MIGKIDPKKKYWLIIAVSSLLTTLIFNLPRFALAFGEKLPSNALTISNQLLGIYLLLSFAFSFLIYTYHLKLKSKISKQYLKPWQMDLIFSLLIIVIFIGLQNISTNPLIHTDDYTQFIYNYGIVSFFLIAALASLLTFVLKLIFSNQQKLLENERLKKENIQNQLSSLKNQINPHFLFNSLNTLSGLTLGDPLNARKFLQNLSELLRSRLQTDTKDLVSLESELNLLRKYIFILKERFNENLVIAIIISPSFFEHKIPPFALQQLVENAVKHNEISSKKPLRINIMIENNYIVVRNPIEAKKALFIQSTNSGLTNLKKRYELIKNQSIIIEQNREFIVRLPL